MATARYKLYTDIRIAKRLKAHLVFNTTEAQVYSSMYIDDCLQWLIENGEKSVLIVGQTTRYYIEIEKSPF